MRTTGIGSESLFTPHKQIASDFSKDAFPVVMHTLWSSTESPSPFQNQFRFGNIISFTPFVTRGSACPIWCWPSERGLFSLCLRWIKLRYIFGGLWKLNTEQWTVVKHVDWPWMESCETILGVHVLKQWGARDRSSPDEVITNLMYR